VFPDAREGRPAVVLQHVEDAAVGVVELGFLLVTEYYKASMGIGGLLFGQMRSCQWVR
jgi:hypothetical protein